MDICKAPHIDSGTFRTVHHIHSMAFGHLQSTSNRLRNLQDICKAPRIYSRIFRTVHQIHSIALGHLQSTTYRLRHLQDSTPHTLNGFWTSVKHLGYTLESSGQYTKYTQWLPDICKAPHIDSGTFRTVHHIHSMAFGHLQSTSNRLWNLQDICKAPRIYSRIFRTVHQIHSIASGHLQSTTYRLRHLQDSTPHTLNGFRTSVKHLRYTPESSGQYTKYTQ